MPEFTEDEFDHDGVVEHADAWDVVGNQVLRVAQVGKPRQHRIPLVVVQRPVLVGDHGDQGVELLEPFGHEVGQIRAFHGLHHVGRRAEDFLVVGNPHRIARLFQFPAKMA
ncbi:MAG: hypothetical protein IPF50_02645 [Proteobacteria bacterium]|nr:hypothetical protein [Pseudomonadota bacterium]